jgi:hypothetical protein
MSGVTGATSPRGERRSPEDKMPDVPEKCPDYLIWVMVSSIGIMDFASKFAF